MAGNYKIKIEPILDTAKLNQQLNQTKQLKLSSAGQTAGNSFMSGFGRAIKERAKYSIANFLIYGTQNAIKDMVANVRELDAAQTELRKVTDLSGRSLEKFTDQAYQVGSKVAKTGTEIVQASTEFAKMGKDTTTALQLSELASRFQNIADTEIDAATAAKFINSQLKAFGDTSTLQKFTGDFEKAQHVIDATNEVANNFAVGTNDLQNALTKAGSAMSVAGNSFEQTIGMVTAGTEIMVGQPAKVGRGLRSIAINISKLAQENERFQAANGKVDIALQNSNGEMRSTYDIMNDLGKVWNNLNETEQTTIATTLAGKTQFEVFANVVKNWGSAVEATNKATNSQGSSLRENAKYLDSIEGHLQSFNSAWEKLSYHLIDSSTIKGVIDIGTDIINIIDKIILALDQLPGKLGAIVGIAGVLATILGAKKLWSMAEGFLGITKAATETAEAVEGIATAASGAKGLSGLVGSLGSLGSALLPLAPALIALGGAFIYANHQYKNSFKGKTEEYKKLGGEITSLQSEIEALENKEGDLTAEEESRLSILKMQLQVLQQQEALKQKQLTAAFDKDAKERIHGKTHKVQGEDVTEREDLTGDKYIKAAEKRFELQKKINHLEEESRKHPLTEEQTRQLEKYNKELDKVFDNEYNALDKLIEEHEALANVDYSKLSADGKAWYDNTHSAYLQALSDVESVRDAVGQAIDTFGSAQFDSWNIDISSLQSADELTAQIKEKIESMGDDEEITFRMKSDDGSFKEVTKKKSELTEEDIDAIVNFKAENVEEVEAEKAEVTKPDEAKIKIAQEGLAEFMAGKQNAMAPGVTPITVTDNGTAGKTGKTIDDASKDRKTTISVIQKGASAIKSLLDSLTRPRSTTVTVNEKRGTTLRAKGKKKGEDGGIAWLGDEGSRSNPKPELVVSEDGAYLAGTQGWELRNLKSSDIVYTAAETKRLLNGKQTFSGTVSEIPRFKKGKKKKKTTAATNANVQKASNKVKKAKSKAAKKKAKKNLKKLEKQRQKKRDAFDKEVEKLKHKAKVNHWTDAKYQSKYKKLYNKYQAYLSDDQSDDYTESREDYENERDTSAFKEQAENILNQQDLANFISAVNASNNLSDDEKKELVQDAGNKFYTSEFNRRIGTIGHGENVGNLVNSIQNNEYLNAKEKQDLIAETYKTSVEYNLKEYKNGKATREQILVDIENYYKTRGQYDETYYKMLDELREADKEKELKRLEDLQKVQDNSLSLAQKYVRRELNLVQKQIDATKEEADQLERLTELEKELTNAKSKKIRVYREGVGFVYERDVEAIEKAEKALDDYKSSLNKTPLEERAEELQAILDLFDEIGDNSAIRDLEVLLGVGNLSELTGGIDTNSSLSSWATWISALFAKKSGLSDLISKLNDVSTSDLDAWLTASGGTQISDALLAQYIGNHSFASGTISAPGGLSRVAERLGGELVWLGKGDSVYSNAISRNLMEWGRYNPAQVMNSNNSASTQVFNFDQIVLPNVYNANDFYRELQNLPNKALQQSARRA